MQPPSPKPSKDVAPFLKSLRQMLETESDAILRWTPDGRAFEIHDMEQMMARVLPKYFKHCKYTSFQRQLNYFNFRKWTKSKAVVCTFSNDCFLRDQPELAWRITRKKSMHVAHSAHNAHSAVHPHQHHQALHHHHHNGHRALPTTGPLAVGVLADRQFHAGAPPKYLPAGLTASPQHGAVLAQPPFWKRPRAVGPPPPTGAMRGLPLLDGGATGANGAVSSAMDALPVHDYDHRRGASRRYYGSPSSMPMSSLAPTAGAPLTDQGEPLDWIDCLLPPSDRVEDAMYSYMYSSAGAGAQLLGVPADPSVSLGPPKFEYVSSLSM